MCCTNTLRTFQLESKEANLSFLLMARSMIEVDPVGAGRCLGLSDRSAHALMSMTSAEILRLASPRVEDAKINSR